MAAGAVIRAILPPMYKVAHEFPATDYSAVRVPVEDVLASNCRVVHDHWRALPFDNFAPHWRNFRLESLPPKVIAFVRVVDVSFDPFDLAYRFWGTGLVTVLGQDRTGKRLSRVSAVRVAKAMAEYQPVVDEKALLALVYDVKTSRPSQPLYAPAIRLPFTADGATVDKVLTYADFSADQEVWAARFAGSDD